MKLERYAIIGDPVSQSLSPAMHAAALEACGINGRYDRLHVTAAQLPATVGDLSQKGFRGFNVTSPHKQAMAELVHSLADSAQRIGAVNTVICRHSALLGHNTDTEGFLQALHHHAGDLQGGRAVVLGTGGAARAVVVALAGHADSIVVFSRRPEKAKAMASVAPGAVLLRAAVPANIRDAVLETALIVNATPLGMGPLGALSPLPSDISLRDGTIVMDLVYGRRTPFQEQGIQAGCRTFDGLEMLVRQGALAFQLWNDQPAPVDVMRKACLRALEERAACFAS